MRRAMRKAGEVTQVTTGPVAGRRTLTLSRVQEERLIDAVAGSADAAASFDAAVETDPVRLEVEVLSCKQVPPGSGVSYGHTYVTTRATTLARVAIGYGHGLPRKAGNAVEVCFRADDGVVHRLPLVGRVAMDEFVADVGDAPVTEGAMMTVFGDPGLGEIPLAEWAHAVDESACAVVACFDERVSRVVHE